MIATLILQNLMCGGCAFTITSKLSEIENISNVNVDVKKASVTFNFNSKKDVANVKDKLKNLGYPTIDESNSLTTKAKSFVSCATGKLLK